MAITPDQIDIMERAHAFWQEFFNEERLEAFDEVTAPDNYHHNGELKDGSGLKKWVGELQHAFRLNVEIVRTIPHEDRVALYWVARPESKADGRKRESMHGMNVLVFDANHRITHNWNCMGALI
jgi:hypothetical protein